MIQQAVLAVNAFAQRLSLPLMIYGDTADVTAREKPRFAYKEFNEGFEFVPEKLMTMKPRQNNRDGAVLRVLAEKLAHQPATTKLLLNISDGQPKLFLIIQGKAKEDIQQVIADYERQGVLFRSRYWARQRGDQSDLWGRTLY